MQNLARMYWAFWTDIRARTQVQWAVVQIQPVICTLPAPARKREPLGST